MTCLVTLVVLGLAMAATLAEAKAKRLQVTAESVQQTFTGDLAHPKLGDQLISNVT